MPKNMLDFRLIKFPADFGKFNDQSRLTITRQAIIQIKNYTRSMETQLPYKSTIELNLNCARLRNGIKSLRIRQEITTFIFPLRNHIKPNPTFNIPKSTIKSSIKIRSQQDLRLNPPFAQGFDTLPQPHMKLDLEGISIRLNNINEDQTLDDYIENNDSIFEMTFNENQALESALVFTMYKRVDKKIKPVSTSFPVEECYVHRRIPVNPLLTLPKLPFYPPEFLPTRKITTERLKILKINEKGFLLPEEEKLFKHIMVINEEAIAFEDAERGTFNESYFSPYIIPTVPHIPWEHKNIPIPAGLREKVMDVLKLKIEAGVYEQSQSSYRSKWFVVLKKNGKLRIVHDLQPLNKISIRDAGMLPIVDDFVDSFSGRQCYTVFDLFWGFDARKIHPKSRDLTAFMTPLGLLQITSLPTGFTNSPAEFQKCMAIILHDEIPNTANIFIDDLPIKGPETQYLDSNGNPELLPENPGIRKFIWEHALDVHRIMHKIKLAGATFAANKAQICLPEVLIVGQTCNKDGRSPDKSKVDKILNWPNLTNQKEVRQFLGLCGTVRIWIPKYSELIRPLTELYRMNTEFIWDERRQTAFNNIKALIASAPALCPIDYASENAVVLSVDSSKIAVGMILSQLADDGKTKHPARYGSLPMDEPASRYSQPKLELFGLYRALRHWRLYIIGVKRLIVEVDAKYIKGMLNEPDLQPNATINRWIQGINLFTFELVHVPADKHRGPDALSRRPLAEGETIETEDDTWLDDIALMAIVSNKNLLPFSEEKESLVHLSSEETICFTTRNKQEETIQSIYEFHSENKIPTFDKLQSQKRFLNKCGEFFIKESRLYKKNGTRPPLLVVTEPKHKYSILLHAHENLGHRGTFSVHEVLKKRFYWPRMRTDVYHHVKSCHECQIRSLKRLEIPLTISAPTILFAKVYIDIMHMPNAHGYKYIVAAKDDLSGTTEAAPLKNATANNLAKFFWECIYCRYGAPIQAVTDNGSEVKEAFEQLLERLGIPQIRITPYNHHANGVVERGHFIIREALLKTCKDKISQWPEYLAEIVFADRVTVNRVTGFSPYQLLHATDPILPLDIAEATFLVEEFRSGISTERLLELRARQIAKHPEDVARAAETLQKARFTSKKQFEQRFIKRLTKAIYEPGELILLRNTQVEMSLDRKKEQRYLGPYEVSGRTPKNNYYLQELDGTKIKGAKARFRILPYITRNHWFMTENKKESKDKNSSESDSDNESEESD
jgi:transposase InsO family protein